MKFTILSVILFCFFLNASAQTLRGTITETGTRIKLMDVFVKNANNKQLALSEKNGKFEIPAEVGNTVIFSSPGYVSDTLYVIDLKTKEIQLALQSIALREVSVKASAKFDPRAEYPEVYEHSKVYALSPSTWFGKSGKDARRLKHYFKHEAEERTVDSAFSLAYVSSLVPLKGSELEDFMVMYRPTYAFLRSNMGESMAVYVNDSYKKWMALPPEKRKVQHLNTVVTQ
ncbi:hypothetical protein [Mucilaginibacter polytrichastri]|uniref:TonB-dependent receptor plug domain-containing protein n=1 Tax=Mucilaginibacter polytrichastri TaxID=1302689 RepID=A0A1Q5ZSD4_9SPHI|nr:hypothetical protein [Mucilaginibacter polytrichastri]OKS84676.1 hypothetical protein RG47T_0109 [Mucilaginibacter polytrichastri]SFT01732.1 hypothetical protein SAMN04487890_108131 [Mucilaginibacter polytrichastri]